MAQRLRLPRFLSQSWLPSLTTNALAFGAASFASSVLCTLFSMYVTPVFTSVYQARSRRMGNTPQSIPRTYTAAVFEWAT